MDSNSSQICRLCLESSDELLHILKKTHGSITISSILNKHFLFQVDKNESLSEWICEICWINLKMFHNFYERIEHRHENVWKSIKTIDANSIKQERSDSPREAVLEPDLNIVKCEETELTVVDFVKSKEDGNDYNEDISCDQSETTQATDDDDQPFNDKSTNDGLGDSNVTGSQLSTIERKGCNVPTRQEKDKQDAQIREYFSMKCDICSNTEFKTLFEARKHYRCVHKKSGYLKCCERKFHRRYKLMDHIRSHINPGAYRCDLCGKSFDSKLALRLHIDHHVPISLREHKCNLCSRSFTKANTLKYHVRRQHSTDKEERILCDKCNKSFRSKLSLACHIRKVHDCPEFFCEICARKYKTRHILQSHILHKHSTTPVPKIQCDICGAWLKHKSSLRAHLRNYHNTQDVECPICNKAIQNKNKLRNHISYVHGDRNHKCVLCDKAFKAAKHLKEHVALHTGEDLYSCQYCEKTFKSNANMYKHRKNAHTAEWTRDNTKRKQNIESEQEMLRVTEQVIQNK